MQYYFINNLLNLKDVIINKISNEDNSIKIFISTKPKEHVCPACSSKTSRVHDYREQIIKDLPIHNKNVYLVLKKRRYVCPHCNKRFYETYDFLPRYYRMTNRLAFFICQQLTKLINMTSVAKIANVSVSTVMRIFELVNYDRLTLPKVLCIDEFRGNAETGKFQCILVDGEKKKIIDILPDRTQSELIRYFKQIPRNERLNVKFFVCDMCRPYVDLAKTFFPNSVIIIHKTGNLGY